MGSRGLWSGIVATGMLLFSQFASADYVRNVAGECSFMHNDLYVIYQGNLTEINQNEIQSFRNGNEPNQLLFVNVDGGQLWCSFNDRNQLAQARSYFSNRFGARQPAFNAPRAPAQPRGNTYISVAFSETSGASNISWGDNESQVYNAALNGCNQASQGHNNCAVVASATNTCVSLVGAARGYNSYGYSGSKNTNRQAAQNEAMRGCRQQSSQPCQLLGTACSWDSAGRR